MVSRGGKVLVFRKDPTPAEVAAATSDPYEDWDPAPLAEPVPPAQTGQNDRSNAPPKTGQIGQLAGTGTLTGLPDARERR